MIRAALLAAELVCAAGACLAGGCSRPTQIDSCDDPLGGVWRANGDERWMILDRGGSLEVYPLFDDSRPEGDPELVVAPRAIDLVRADQGVRGSLRRRYMRGAERCDAEVPVRITSCAGDRLELVLADPVPPTAFAPCTWGRPASSRLERWHRD